MLWKHQIASSLSSTPTKDRHQQLQLRHIQTDLDRRFLMRASQNFMKSCTAPWSIGSKDFINILQPQGRQERFSSTCSCHRRTAIFERQLPARRTATRIVIKINTQLLHVLNHSHYKFHQKPFITTLSTAILISVLEPPNRELRISTVGEPLLGLSSKQSCSTALTTRRSNFIIPKD